MENKETAIGFKKWEKQLGRKHLNSKFIHSLKFNFEYLKDNKLKMFQQLCCYCDNKENYEHLFITCPYNKQFWLT